MHRALVLALVTAAALSACSPRPLSETIVIVDADAPTRALGGRITFAVRGGSGRDPSTWPTPMMQTMPLLAPLEYGVIPEGGDASRGFEVRATALDYAGNPVGEARVVSGYREGDVKVLRLRVEHACMGVTCPPGMACAGGTCRNEYVDAVSLPSNDPVDFTGTYMVSSTVVSNGCMIGSDGAGGTTNGIQVDVTQTADGHAHCNIGGVWSGVYDFYVGTHEADGIIVDNHLTAVLVGNKDLMSGTCNPYRVNAVIDLDLSSSSMVVGTVSGYAVTGGAASCSMFTGCTTVFAITGMRTM